MTLRKEHIGLEQALASERLKTDGAEVLWDYGHRSEDEADRFLCKDLKIAGNPLEARVVFMKSARVFGLANAQLTGPAMASW
jgi:hypothetical protein